MFVYLAHPIDQVLGKGERTQVTKRMVLSVQTALTQQGISAFRPGHAYELAKPDGKPYHAHLRAIDKINRQALFESDAVIAVVPPGVPTLGVPAEIELALTLNRPTLIVTTASCHDFSVQMANWLGRGASVMLIDENGLWFAEPPNLAEMLRSLPDPTMLVAPTDEDLLIQRVSTNAKMPSRAYRGDAGLDLAVVGEHDLEPFKYQLLPTGVKAAVPHGFWGFMTGRSSSWAKHELRINTAVIDSGYRGELMVGVTWTPEHASSPTKTIMPGTRLAQYVILPAYMGDVVEVDELPGSERGESGYGSSGH